MQLHNLNLVETSETGYIYKGYAPEDVMPGQSLLLNDQLIEIIRSDPMNEQCQLLLISPVQLATQESFQLLGQPFVWQPESTVTVFCEGTGNFIGLHWINYLRRTNRQLIPEYLNSIVFFAQEDFKFRPAPSRYITPEYPSHMIACVPLLDDLNITSRLVSEQFQPGCFEGTLVEMVLKMPNKPTNWVGICSEETITGLSDILGPATATQLSTIS